MGLDAFVRCRCFEEGKTTAPPVPLEDLFVDEEGGISSRTLCTERKRLRHDDYWRRYDELEDRLLDWTETCCAHEDMHACDEFVCNLSGWSKLRWLFNALGGETPTLAGMLPYANGGSFPAEFADAALAELAALEGKLPQLLPDTYTDLVRRHDGVVAWRHYDGEPYEWRHYPARLTDGALYYWEDEDPDEPPHESADFASPHFRATLIEGRIDPCFNTQRRGTVLLEDLEGRSPSREVSWWGFCQIDTMFREDPVEYRVVKGSDEEWGRWKIGIIRRLLEASLETGNPIQWC